MTNADIIRKMTDWEFAEFIYNISNNLVKISTCDEDCELCKSSESYCIYQIGEWLEELKAIKSDGFTDDLLNMGFTKGYNNAIDDFVRFTNTMPTVESEDGTIRPMWLEEMAEKLKAGGK